LQQCLFEIARVLVRLGRFVSLIVNANDSVMRPAEELRVTDCVADSVRSAVQKSTERQHIRNEIDAAFIFSRATAYQARAK
jgi:hypothetical protein